MINMPEPKMLSSYSERSGDFDIHIFVNHVNSILKQQGYDLHMCSVTNEKFNTEGILMYDQEIDSDKAHEDYNRLLASYGE